MNQARRSVVKLVLAIVMLMVVTPTIAKATDSKHSTRKPAASRILFVGNSFSFYNDGIHNHLGALIRASGEWQRGKNRMRLLTLSGGHLHENLPILNAYLSQQDGPWHAVVIQAHSNEAIDNKKQDRFKTSLTQMIQAIKQNGSMPLLFMTWGYQGDKQMREQLITEYTRLAAQHSVPLIPVGVAFALAEKLAPAINLYSPDVLGTNGEGATKTLSFRSTVKHPSQAGTYLAACVFYASLYGRSPEGNIYTAGLPLDVAQTLQQISWQAVTSATRNKDRQ